MADESNTPEGIAGAEPVGLSLEDAAGSFESLFDEPDEGTPESGEEEATEESPEAEDGGEEEAPSDEDDDAEGEGGDQPRDEQGRFISKAAKVKLDDGSVVTVDDLIKGSLRQADYTRKTQEIAAQRKQFEERESRYAQYEQQLAQHRDLLLTVLEREAPKKPDPELLQSDPLGYMQAQATYQQRMEELSALTQERTAAQQRQQERMAEEQKAIKQREVQQLLEAFPDLKDKAKFEQFRSNIFSSGGQYGFSEQELANVTDHRMIRVLADAAKYRKLQSQKPKVQEKTQGKPPVQAGRRADPKANQARAQKGLKEELRSTGSMRAGARILESLIE